MREHMAEVG